MFEDSLVRRGLVVIEPGGGERVGNKHAAGRQDAAHFLQEFLCEQVLWDVLPGEGIEQDVVVGLPAREGTLDEHASITHMHAHALVRREHEEALGHAHYGLVDLDEVLRGFGVDIVKGARDRAAAEADHQDALGFRIHEQAREHHSDVGEDKPVRVLEVDA